MIKEVNGKKEAQVAKLREIIQNGTESDMINLNNGVGIPFSANLDLTLTGVRVEKTSVFTSASKPLLLPFYHKKVGSDDIEKETFTLMFKKGDDMRQDAIILQLFNIMDLALKEVGLNCKFSIYNLIAFTTDDGMLPFVPDSKEVTEILKTKEFGNSISGYFKVKSKERAKIPRPSDEGKTEAQIIQDRYDEILENYIVSSAGYATATFLLGIGDRHLQNIMICGDGKLFHIDFGFIFGKEPNAFKQRYATKLRLSKEMLEPMSLKTTAKSTDPNYEKFERKFVETFLILRNKTSYMMNLIHLMIHSGIGDL